ncbi:MAG: flagellar hook-associated protein FlgL [Gammaproteobacteria bacterium]|nr:flagellar hook-associated protein FlgL [Gammaproteobacteria bacterium]
MTRISSSFYFERMKAELGRQQTALARNQEQIGTGKKLLRPSDDPAASARLLDIKQSVASLKQYRENGVHAEQRLGMEETTLESVTELLQRVQTLAVAASNSAIQSEETRAAYAAEVRERLEALVDLGNTRNGDGEFLFSGFKGKTMPFVKQGDTVIYQGDQGRPSVHVGPDREVAVGDSGDAVFMRSRDGNGQVTVGAAAGNTGTGVIDPATVVDAAATTTADYEVVFTSSTTFDVVNTTTSATVLAAQTFVDGSAFEFDGLSVSISGTPANGDRFTVSPSRSVSVFKTLQDFIDTLDAPNSTVQEKTRYKQDMASVLSNLEQAQDHMLRTRASVGARLNAVDTTDDDSEAALAQLSVTMSEIEDLDYAEAISQMQFRLTTLEAVQKTFVNLQNTTLIGQLRF